MGIRTVAVYSEADSDALHVKEADESCFIGEASPAMSYLRIDKILDATKEKGCEAIHPGYGFLSENAEFASKCLNSGITFIGPSAEAIRLMGETHKAKSVMEKAGVPVVPGDFGEEQSKLCLLKEAEKIESDSNQILDFTKNLKNVDEEMKLIIVESLWEIIYSDNKSDMYEANLMRRLTGLLYLDPKKVGEIKERINLKLK